MLRLAFVPPRFGPGVLGGSEAVMAEAAAGLALRGHEVEVLTTCAVDGYTWANELPPGVSEEGSLVVRRFEVTRRPSRAALAAQLSVQAGRVPDLDHQVSWLGFHFACPGMFEHLLRHGREYDAVVFAPYLFWNTTACMPLVADRAVFMPCLHDETYARLDVVRSMLGIPALVWFLSGPEHALAHRLAPLSCPHSVTGAGVIAPRRYDPSGFRAKHGLERPFFLYAGRREEDKGLSWLLGTLAAAVAPARAARSPAVRAAGSSPAEPGRSHWSPAGASGSSPAEPGRSHWSPAGASGSSPAGSLPPAAGGLLDIDLVIIGKGDPASSLRVPPELTGCVFDLGFVDDADRDNAFAAATAYVQPSRVESFSRTVMESWLAGTPVLALAENEVVAWHCRRSGGGLLFSDAASLAGAVEKLTGDPAFRSELGLSGRRYVLEHYNWSLVLDRMEASLLAWAGDAGRSRRAAAEHGAEASSDAAPSRPAGRARRHLVVGSYPPVPGTAASATLVAVRRAWEGGGEAVVASPRPSAAQYVLSSAGTGLARQLRALARRERCDGLVLCIEPGWPLRGTPARRRREASTLATALRAFREVEVVVTGTPRDFVTDLDALAPVWPLVSRVTVGSQTLAGVLSASVFAVAPEAPPVRVLEVDPVPGVPPLEPGELLLATRARRAAGRLARRVLGGHEPAVRALVSKLSKSP